MPKYEFMRESCKKTFEEMLTAAERAGPDRNRLQIAHA
jgi:hypothetical protein